MNYAEIAEKIKTHKDEISKEINIKPNTIVKWCDEPKRFLNVGVNEICTMAVVIGVNPSDVLNILEQEVIQYMKKQVQEG